MQEINQNTASALPTLQRIRNSISIQIAKDPNNQALIDPELVNHDEKLIDRELIEELDRRIKENPELQEKMRQAIAALPPGSSLGSAQGVPELPNSPLSPKNRKGVHPLA